MLDYIILNYEVEYIENSATRACKYTFNTEEDAVKFIKKRKENWKYYRLLQHRAAKIIEF